MRPQLPRIDPKSLKNFATSEAVERVWQRLENEVPRGRLVRSPVVGWLALASVTFAAGVWFGTHLKASPIGPVQVAAEPSLRWAPAAGPTVERTASSLGTSNHALARTPLRRSHPPAMLKGPDVLAVENVAPGAEQLPAVATFREAEPPDWMRLANLGEYQRAREALERDGGFDAVLNSATADKLMAAVDVARATGQKGRALQALRLVLEQFSASPEAPLAAWTLGNMLEQAGDQVGAASAYAWYQRLSPRGDFAEDAVVRQVEALIGQGQTDEAQRLAKSYGAEFPESLRLRELSEQLERAATASGVVPEVPGKPSTEAEGESTQSESNAQGAAAAPAKTP